MFPATTSPLLSTARAIVRSAADELGMSDDEVLEFLEPEEITSVRFGLDDAREVTGWRVRHSSARGPAKGGVRFTPGVTLDDVSGLATLMTLKTAVTRLPFGGGKGGLVVPRGLDREQTRTAAREYGAALADALGPELDVAAPDIGTDGQTMLDIVAGWAGANGLEPDDDKARSVVTGKPLDHGGLELRTGATARGIEIAIAHLERHHQFSDTPTVAVQGFGAVGGALAQILADKGWRVVALADSSGTVTDHDGLDVSKVRSAKELEGSVTAIGGTTGPSTDVFATDCDLLVLAAQEAAVDAAVARDIRAGAIVEGANAPCSVDGDQVLAERDITVVPDIVANAGGVTGSWLEWDVARGGPTELLGQRFNMALESSNERLWDQAEERSVRLRDAATILALQSLNGRR